MKKLRQKKLLELISNYEINTQEELIARLGQSGFDVTQATVSRDIRDLKISKIPTGTGSYRYVAPLQKNDTESGRFSDRRLNGSIISVDYASNIVVLKTHAGLAQAVAVGIDGMNLTEVLGCVAGDDTIMIVTRNAEAARDLSLHLREELGVD